jgi:V-type H+-transporting ATPase subunit A
MLKCIITFYEESQKAIADSPPEKKVTWAYIKTTLSHVVEKVKDTKFVVRTLMRFKP